MIPMEWNGKRIMQQVQVHKNLAKPTILGFDGIHNLGITYQTETKEFMVQNDILHAKFSKADLRTLSVLKIPARTKSPVRLGTTTGARHTPMAAGFKSVSTVGNIDHPQLFAQPGLVIPDHLGDVTIMLQNMSDVDIEIPRCTTIGSIENLNNEYFGKISPIDQEDTQQRLSKDLPLPNLCQKKSKKNFLSMPT
jgi:hypothetical protein